MRRGLALWWFLIAPSLMFLLAVGARGAPGPRPDLPASAEATQVLKAMHAEAKRRHTVHSLHLLWALMQSDTGPIADILQAAGATPAQVREQVQRAL